MDRIEALGAALHQRMLESMRARLTECPMCNIEPEAGWIEMPNNGPIVPCNLCNPKGEKPRPTE